MPNIPEDQIWQQFWPMVDGTVMGALGGVVNGLRQKSFRDWGQTAAAILTAGFAGMLTHLICGWLGADVRLQFALSGIAGYSGGGLLDDAAKRARLLLNRGADVLTEKLDAHGGDRGKAAEKEPETEAYFVVPKWEPTDEESGGE